ncbi:PHB depolymerase family esterase [Frigidibacter sp.]|uniref:alpha/beta hydrolase family esterase n=1 Tax=Frigidibacter sp. TaxID=2586418 RepID=UPI002732D367|nr:hypothetical protein [Frigidibacter sp.]MDP3340264.1 hypothetical protein [Frigidibacter sp.]
MTLRPRAPSPFRMAAARPAAQWAHERAAPGPLLPQALRPLSVPTAQGLRLAHVAPGAGAAGLRVLAFHGGGGDSRRFAGRARLHEALQGHAGSVVYPQAEGHWADGRPGIEPGWQADLALVQALAEGAPAPLCLAGASNGGMFALRLACELAVPPTAVVAVSAAMPADLALRAPLGPPVPLMLVQWTEDPLLPHAGGPVAARGGVGLGQRGRVLGAEETVAFWRARNRCSGPPRHRQARISGQRAEIHAWSGGAGGADLWRVLLQGNGHGWPSRAPGAGLAGSLEQMAARFLIWFSQKDRPGNAGLEGVSHDVI